MGYRQDTTKCTILLNMAKNAQIPVCLKGDQRTAILDSTGGAFLSGHVDHDGVGASTIFVNMAKYRVYC